MKCSLCKNEILPHPLSGYDGGNNGHPLVDGRVCDDCDGLVIQERLRIAINERKTKNGVNNDSA